MTYEYKHFVWKNIRLENNCGIKKLSDITIPEK